MAKRPRDEVFDEAFLQRLQRLHLIAKRLAAVGPAGARRSRRLGDGLEFADHRAYAPGDDVRFIDWPYYARMERLLLRLFHEHSEAPVVILLDASASMDVGLAPAKFDYARQAAAALAYVAMGGLERVEVQPFAETLADPLRAGRSRGGIFGVLDYLASLRPQGRTRLGPCAEQFVERVRPPGVALVVSDLLDAEAELSEGLARLRLGGWQTSVLHVYGPADASPQLAGAVMLVHSELGRRWSVGVTDELLAGYRRRWGRFQAACERTCLSRGAVYVAAPTDLPFDRLVLWTLRKAGVLAG